MVALSPRLRALSLVPVAALSAVWTVDVAIADTRPGSAVAVPAAIPAIPSSIQTAVTTPASATVVASAQRARLQQALAGDPVSAIPEQALVAYQRAATVIDAADPTCSLDWSLLAALGKVESDHGRSAHVGTAIADAPDTDGGEYDGDAQHDRGVGPLQLLPSTWSSVKVDGDSDGVRDPRDVEDAALAAAVYLCSGAEDLSTAGGRRTALVRYNPAPGYASLVLRWAGAYATSEPSAEWAFAAASPGPVRLPVERKRPHAAKAPAATAAPEALAPPGQGEPAEPADTPAPAPAHRPDPVRDALTVAGANLLCTLDGLSALLQPAVFHACVDDRLHRVH